jgi:ABC-type uncharacterized transport system permease subunit
MAAAATRIGRLKRIDRAAVLVITLGGVAVVVGVLGILLFIAAEAVPLFRPARVVPAPRIATATGVTAALTGLRGVGVDEYRRYLFTVEPSARVVFLNLSDGHQALDLPVPGLAPGTPIVSSSRSLLGNYLAAGTGDGRVALMQIRFTPRYENAAMAALDPEGRSVRSAISRRRVGSTSLRSLAIGTSCSGAPTTPGSNTGRRCPSPPASG